MKSTIKLLAVLIVCGTLISSCKKNEPMPTIVYYEQQDQMGRPGINTVFVKDAADKDVFNVTTPSMMGAAFKSKFQTRLMALNPGYTTNALGLDSPTFTGILATDVLNVSTTGATKFFTSTTDFLTGRGLSDDVIDNELTLIFGGPKGDSNPTLTSDNVNSNDKAFLSSFPYMANPW